MYEVLSNNRVKQLPYRKPLMAHEMDAYIQEYNQLPTYPISGSHNWKEGQLIEEGKDFKRQMMFRAKMKPHWSYTDNEGFYNSWPEEKQIAALPIPSVTNEEDELWELTKKKLLDLMIVEGKIKEVRKVMRSVAIVFESGSAYWLRLEKQSDVSLDD